jgi:hypothetical protein
MIKYDGASYPYFYDLQKDASGKTSITDWTRKNVAGVSDTAAIAIGTTVIPVGGLTQVQAYRLMGACYNLNVLIREPGAYLHARTYSQRLVFDTVDFLDNNLMDFSSLITARAVTVVATAVAKASRTTLEAALAGTYVGTNVNVFANDGTLATESMAWLAGTHYSDAQSASLTKNTDFLPTRLRP